MPYQRDAAGGRPWAIPGTQGLEHRIGGLSKEPGTGNVSYAPEHHEQMVAERAAKVARLAEIIPPAEAPTAPSPASSWSSAGEAPTARCAAPSRMPRRRASRWPTCICGI